MEYIPRNSLLFLAYTPICGCEISRYSPALLIAKNLCISPVVIFVTITDCVLRLESLIFDLVSNDKTLAKTAARCNYFVASLCKKPDGLPAIFNILYLDLNRSR